MISAKHQRNKILVERFLHCICQTLARAGNFIQVARSFFAEGLLFRLRHDHVADVFYLSTQVLEPRLQTGYAQCGGAHVDTAAACAEVHRYAYDAYFVRHKFSLFDPSAREGTLRIDAIQHPWEGDHFPNVLGSAYPGHGAFQAQTEARVGHAAVAPQVEIPLKG